MDFINIINAVLSLGILGLIFGALLGFAADKFKVEVDEKIPIIREIARPTVVVVDMQAVMLCNSCSRGRSSPDSLYSRWRLLCC